MNRKKEMEEPCGLLGRKLGHTYSPVLHSMLGEYEYRRFEVEPEDVAEFFSRRAFHAINVTMPYKKVALEICDTVSEEARAIGSVNTVVKDAEGHLHGYNTDAPGMVYMLHRANIDVHGRKCMILGSGGSSVMAQYMLRRMGAGEITVISRNGKDNYGNISRHADAQIIINATPVGMFPDTGVAGVDVREFPHCEGVADFIYNPAMTRLLLDARRAGIRHTNGLPMLVAQAKYASDLFFGTQRNDSIIEPLIGKLSRQMLNAVLTGNDAGLLKNVGCKVALRSGRELVDLSKSCLSMSVAELNSELNRSGRIVLLDETVMHDTALADIVLQNGTVFRLTGKDDTEPCGTERDTFSLRCGTVSEYTDRIMHEIS